MVCTKINVTFRTIVEDTQALEEIILEDEVTILNSEDDKKELRISYFNNKGKKHRLRSSYLRVERKVDHQKRCGYILNSSV